MIAERVKIIQADVEDQLATIHKADDAMWAYAVQKAQRAAHRANAEIAAACRSVRIPDDMMPSLRLMRLGRSDNASAGRRAEPRRLAYARIDAAAQSAQAIAAALAANPDQSDRQIFRQLGADHKTVGNIRATSAETAGEIPTAGEAS
jgi:hypothetical protein